MNQIAIIKYSLRSTLKNLSPFYLTLCALIILFMYVNTMNTSGSLGAWDVLAMFAACGVATCFKERFHFFIQNGYSRKTLYFNFLTIIVISAVLMTLFDYGVYVLSNQGIVNYESFFTMIYEQATQRSVIEYLLWHVCNFMSIMSVSLFFTILFYRMKKWMRIVCFIVLPTILILGFPLIGMIFPDLNLIENLFEISLRMLGIYETINPYIAMGYASVFSIVFAIGSYFIIKKIDLQKA